MRSDNRLIILGLGRSGTSWLSKIFDYHPGVFYSHEPELMLPTKMVEQVKAYPSDNTLLNWLFTDKSLRTMRKKPIRKKEFRSDIRHYSRVGVIYIASAAKYLVGGRVAGWPIPDLFSTPPISHVSKSVSFLLEIANMAPDRQDVKFIHLVRHPAGVVSSTVRGRKAGYMARHYLPPRELLEPIADVGAGVFDWTEEQFTEAQILALRWAAYNDAIINILADLPNCCVVKYEDLCADPIGVTRELFEFAGLSWRPEVDEFLSSSLSADRNEGGYHGLVRPPLEAANMWKSQIDEKTLEQVLAICRKSKSFQMFS